MSWARNSVGERGDNIGLPDVTTADNGKIMEVESGEWKLKEGSGGGGGLPEITEADEGKVLTVESGEAAWATAGGGGGGLVVTSSYDELTEQETLSVTAQEIITAMQTGPVILCITNILDSDPPTEYMFNLLTVYNNSNEPHEYAHTFNFGDAVYYANSLSEHPQYPGPALPD